MVKIGNMLYTNKLYREDLKNIIEDNNFELLMNSSILVTGASGMIGSVIIDTLLLSNELLNLNIKIFALSRDKKSLIHRFKSNINNPLFSLIVNDINTPLNTSYNFDYIIHAASNAYPKAFSIDPVGTIMTNINGVNNLLNYGKNHNIKRFLFVSSGEVYGQAKENIAAFEEDYSGYVNPINPRSCYPNGKRAAETLCISYRSQYDLDTVIARPCHTFGPSATAKDNRAASQFIQRITQDKDIIMKSDGLQLRSYIYVSDCVSALFSILLNGECGKAYNVANKNSNVTIREIAQQLANSSNKKIIFENPSDKERDSFNPISKSVLDSTKLESLGWKARYNVRDALNRTVSILKQIL
ncbi:MAG: NAD-dependent epimerase/dehydratase family protein [Sphaerochaetaceae bacterium]|nr:NAD-dependent epimerase/dehydratase family protein [Sphaerochaetaceae bacterium]